MIGGENRYMSVEDIVGTHTFTVTAPLFVGAGGAIQIQTILYANASVGQPAGVIPRLMPSADLFQWPDPLLTLNIIKLEGGGGEVPVAPDGAVETAVAAARSARLGR